MKICPCRHCEPREHPQPAGPFDPFFFAVQAAVMAAATSPSNARTVRRWLLTCDLESAPPKGTA